MKAKPLAYIDHCNPVCQDLRQGVYIRSFNWPENKFWNFYVQENKFWNFYMQSMYFLPPTMCWSLSLAHYFSIQHLDVASHARILNISQLTAYEISTCDLGGGGSGGGAPPQQQQYLVPSLKQWHHLEVASCLQLHMECSSFWAKVSTIEFCPQNNLMTSLHQQSCC